GGGGTFYVLKKKTITIESMAHEKRKESKEDEETKEKEKEEEEEEETKSNQKSAIGSKPRSQAQAEQESLEVEKSVFESVRKDSSLSNAGPKIPAMTREEAQYGEVEPLSERSHTTLSTKSNTEMLHRNFRIGKSLGVGGFGRVVEAINVVDQSKYAMKIIPFSLDDQNKDVLNGIEVG
ncbi:hypothetical protein RFI_24142, partial [Reticulomyxa filosa]